MSETIKEMTTAEAVEMAEAVEIEEKPYKFRKLASCDIFLLFTIISKIGFKEFKTCFGDESVKNAIKGVVTDGKLDESGIAAVGASVVFDAASVLLANAYKCEKEIYQLLANTSNLTIDEITAEGNAVLFAEMVIDFVKKEEFPDFFKVVSRLFK